jgi:large subunit ribosomal protein L32
MPVPKYRTSKSKRNMRRSHHAITPRSGSSCPNCGSIRRPHTVCDSCGHYRGKQVLEPKSAELNFEDGFDTAES